MSESELIKAVRAGKEFPAIYLWGRDTAGCESLARSLAKRLCPEDARDLNYHFYLGSQLPMSELADVVEALPVLSDRVLIVINDLNADKSSQEEIKRLCELISSIDASTTSMLIYATGTDPAAGKKALSAKNKKLAEHIVKAGGAVVELGYKRPKELVGYVRKRAEAAGCSISDRLCERLCELQGCNLLLINSELDKLTSYCHGGEITAQMMDELVSGQLETDVYKLSRAVISRKKGESYRLLDSLYSRQPEALSLLHIIIGATLDIYRAKLAMLSGVSDRQVAEDFSYRGREFAVKNAMRDSSGIPIERIRECLEILFHCDVDMKSKRTDSRVMLEEAITKMLESL